MHPRIPARAGLLAAAAALIAMLVAVPNAGAASFSGGNIKLDFKALKVGVKTVGASPNTKTGGTFPFAAEAGEAAPVGPQASGNLNVGATTATSLTLTRGKKKIVLQSMVQKLKAGRGIFSAKIGGKGKLIDFFDQASTNRIVADGKFTTLSMQTANMTLTKAGAAALNKAFSLKGKSALKAKGKAGTASFTADRLLEFSGGQSSTTFDTGFYDQLKNNCDITLAPVGTAQAITPGEAAPRGGAVLNVIGGSMKATTLSGFINHDTTGGTSLDRPQGSSKGAAYHTEITGYEFLFDQNPPIVRAYSSAVDLVVPIGTLEGGVVTTDLTGTGGTVSITGGVLKLSQGAAGLLQQQTGCTISAGQTLATTNTTAQVK